MDDEIELFNDGDGMAVIGEPGAVERFLNAQNLASRDLGLEKLTPIVSKAAGVANAGSQIAANSGRWVQLTEKSAQALKQTGTLMKGSENGVKRAVLMENGRIKGLLEIVRTPTSMLTNPAILAGAAGLMAQLAMEQKMAEITDYLESIDEKVDDLLRAHNDAVLADMIGVDFVIDEAMAIREHVGRVSEVTWSKVQDTSGTVARTQAYTLRQLDALAEKIEDKAPMGDLAKVAKEIEPKVREWLAVLARCFQLQDAIAILEIDRVLDSSPEELDEHRRALQIARSNRLNHIAETAKELLARMDAAAGNANKKVLTNPFASRSVVASSNHVASDVVQFGDSLGIPSVREAVEARRWLDAVEDVRDKAIETGAEGFDSVRRFGASTLDRARSLTHKLSSELAERTSRHGEPASDHENPAIDEPRS